MTIGEKESTPNIFFEMVTERGVTDASKSNPNSNPNSNQLNNESAHESCSVTEDFLLTEGSQAEESSLSANSTDMPHEARRVLVHLMRQGVIIAVQKPKLFELVCRYESYVRRHLSEVYLQLVLDAKAGLVFVASPDGEFADSNEESDAVEEFSSLISKRTLSLYDTLLLLVLRKHYQDRESSGEQKITIDLERLESYLTPFLPLTDHARLDRKKLITRVKEMVKRKVLSTIRGSEERYEITPVIRYVVNAEFLESMLDEYKRLAKDAGIENSMDGSVSEANRDKLEN